MAQIYTEKKASARRGGISRSGFTLMEILLATALLSIVVSASFGFLYWQMRTQAHLSQSSLTIKRLSNTQTLLYKVLRAAGPASLTVDVSLIEFKPDAATSIELFKSEGGNLLHNGQVVMENVVASFTALTASASPVLAMADDASNLVRVELSALTGRETQKLNFIVRPRGYDNGI